MPGGSSNGGLMEGRPTSLLHKDFDVGLFYFPVDVRPVWSRRKGVYLNRGVFRDYQPLHKYNTFRDCKVITFTVPKEKKKMSEYINSFGGKS